MASLSDLAEQAEDQIDRLRFELDPVRTREYIDSLDTELKAHPIVAIATAGAHISGGEFRYAAESIEATGCLELFKDRDWLFDEHMACLALLSAVIEVYRRFQFERLGRLLKEIEDVYINPVNTNRHTPDDLKDSDSSKARICRETEFLNQIEHDVAQIDETLMSNARLRLEYVIMFTYYTAIQSGLSTSDDFAKRYKVRHRTITQYLRRHRKPILEGLFNFLPNRMKLFGGVPAAITFYNAYLEELDADSYSQKASALINLCEHQVTENLGLAASSLDAALALYVEKNNITGQMICEYHRIGFFAVRNKAPTECLRLYKSLAERFLEMSNHSWYLNSSMRAFHTTANDKSDKSLLNQITPLKEAMCDQLRKAEDNYQIRRLNIWEAFDWSQHKVSAEQARLIFEDYLVDHYDQLTPSWLFDIYGGLSSSYYEMQDFEKAVEYAEKQFDFGVKLENFPYQDLSRVRNKLARLRHQSLNTYFPSRHMLLRPVEDDSLLDDGRGRCSSMATTEVADLENWIQTDIQHGYEELSRAKRVTINDLSQFLHENFLEDVNAGKIVLSSQGNTEEITLNSAKLDLGDLIRLSKEGKGQEGIQLANLKLQNALKDPVATTKQLSFAYYICALAYDIATWHKTHPNQRLSHEEKCVYLEYQVQYMRKHLDLCIAVGDYESLLRSTFPFQQFMRSYILLHPELKSDLITEVQQIFLQTERAVEVYRKSMLRSHDISTFLRMRKVVSGYMTTQLYSAAASFYIILKDAPSAWVWVQKSRARALFDIITNHHASSDALLSVLKDHPTKRDLLAEESALAKKVEQGTTKDYLEVKIDLENYREKLMAVPVLEELLGKPATTDSFGFSEGRAIYYHVRDWLPTGVNVVLVTWFIETSGSICLMTMDTRSCVVQARSQLALRYPEVCEWIDDYLTFPQGSKEGVSPLEKKLSALKPLTKLVEALEFMTQPEDFLVLSPPAEFAGIPLQGIPIGDSGLSLIERNPVVYSPSFRLYLECVCKVQVCKALQDRSLGVAVFAAAYEGRKDEEKVERAKIFDSIKALSDTFSAHHILGHNLTPSAFRSALESSPWVHYHGHVHYESTEALNQCYLLSDGIEPSLSKLSLKDPSPPTDPTQSATSSNLQHNPLLSAHLSSSTRLRVSDIFTMDLRATKPFICSIACDSGTQDVNAGHEPLGLVSALFCAGASSMLGTLWPIASPTGTAFTRHFYAALRAQIEERPLKQEARFGRVIDVARAVREAVRKLKGERKDPYSWAGFVLHGAGFYRLEQPVEL